MKEYASEAIRNVAFASHGGSGKTTLVEACLFRVGAIDRAGRVEDGNTASDLMPEEIKRHSSIWTTLLAAEHGDTKLNFLDCPGYADFFGEVVAGLTAAENVVLVANATAGVEMGLEAAAHRAHDQGLSCFVFVNHLDRERASFDTVYEGLRRRLHIPAVAIAYPLGQESSLRGYVDVVQQKAYEDHSGKLTEVPLPDECAARVAELRQTLVECVVECDDGAMEKYLEGQDLTASEVQALLKQCVACGGAVPVLGGSATKGVGINCLLDTLAGLAASPVTAQPRRAVNSSGEEITVRADSSAPFSGFVYKTFSDPHTGRLSFIKIVSGTIRKDSDIINLDRNHHEKLAHLFLPVGKRQTEVPVLHAGDIFMVPKLKGTSTGDSLSSQPNGPRFPRPALPESLYSLAIEPATRGDDDKLGEALSKLVEEDRTLHIERQADTHQTVISGLGDIHLATMVSRLKSGFGVAVNVADPRVPYKETIRQKVKYEGKLKKQSGGHGQFADVWLEIEPKADGGFEFVDKIVGGVVPRSFIPAVEEGVREALHEGPLAGYPLVDLRVTLYDGKYHDVDSSFQTFKVAASMGLRGGTREASPVLLEPIMEAAIEVPETLAGEVVGDLNSRRGQILGMEPSGEDHTVCVKAYVPEAELLKYPIMLRSLTHGEGRFTKHFDHYSPVPDNVARGIVEEYQKRRAA